MNHMSLPLKAEYDETNDEYKTQMLSAGFNLLSPVLYLIYNVAIKRYRNVEENCSMTGSKIIMRVNNSFQTSMPIIKSNADIETILLYNDLCMMYIYCVHYICLLMFFQLLMM